MGLYLVLHVIYCKRWGCTTHIWVALYVKTEGFSILNHCTHLSLTAAIQTRDTWLGRTINAHEFFYCEWRKTEIWFSIALIQFKHFNLKNVFLPFQLKGTLQSTWAPLQTHRAENQLALPETSPLGTTSRAGGWQLTQELQDLLQQLPPGCQAE